jgi:hypothetical protein
MPSHTKRDSAYPALGGIELDRFAFSPGGLYPIPFWRQDPLNPILNRLNSVFNMEK